MASGMLGRRVTRSSCPAAKPALVDKDAFASRAAIRRSLDKRTLVLDTETMGKGLFVRNKRGLRKEAIKNVYLAENMTPCATSAVRTRSCHQGQMDRLGAVPQRRSTSRHSDQEPGEGPVPTHPEHLAERLAIYTRTR